MLSDHRVEVVLVVAIAVVASLGVRTAFQPADGAEQVDRFENQYEMELGDIHPWFTGWTRGDGQAYALIAADVSGQKLAKHVRESTYRFARAGYGWVSAGFALGQTRLIPYGMALVGGLSVSALLGVAVFMRERIGPRAWWIVLNPAVYIGFAGDTSEPLGVLMLVVAMAWSSWAAAIILGVTRPTYLIAMLGKWNPFVAGLAATVLLAIYSFFAFGTDRFVPDAGRFGLPFASFLEYPTLSGALLAAAALATVVVGVRARDWTWVVAGVFVLCLGTDVLRAPFNAWRAAGFLPVMWVFGPGYLLPFGALGHQKRHGSQVA